MAPYMFNDSPASSDAASDGGQFIDGPVNGHAASGLPADGSGSGSAPVPIAIVGMGMRLPGHCNDAESFWSLLMEKREGVIPIPASRWNADGFHDMSGRPGTIKAREGNFLDIDVAAFDLEFWSMPEVQAEKVDPQQRLLLETVYEALENAGEKSTRGRNIGVFVGSFAEDWTEMHARDAESQSLYSVLGHMDIMRSNLVSYEFDWKGPSVSLKTACSASLSALDVACKALAAGECESAIVGGTNLVLGPAMTSVLSNFQVASADGRSRSFDANATGYGRAEAVSALFLKRLDHAVRDGNPIRAVVRATVCNGDGKTPGITQPNPLAQEALMRAAYQSAGLASRLHETAFVECHGTGTTVGDPLEVKAVARVFGHDGMVIGSVKSNIGHSEAASGNTSVIKSVLALEHLIIPPNINFNTPNPQIPWKEAKLTVPTEPLPWPKDRQERISVNSFGIGGSNAHAILESARSYGLGMPRAATEEEAASSPRLGLLVFSAKTASSLQASVAKHARYLERHGAARLRDMAYTLDNRRDHHDHRTFAVTDGREPLAAQASVYVKDETRPLLFVFTGQGAQWAQMGSRLMDDFPSVKANVAEMDKILADCRLPPAWSIAGELAKSKLRSLVGRAEFSQPLCTAVQIVLVDLLRSWGISPDAVAGHSSGEIAAAYASGALTKKEAILAAYFRGYVTSEKSATEGAMAAIGLGADDVRPYLTEGVVIACENSPESTTVSGDGEAVRGLLKTLSRDAPGVFARMLQVDMAYHSHHMKAYGLAYEIAIREVKATKAPTIPLFSSVTGKRCASAGIFDAAYWRSNLERPVRFHSAVRNMLVEHKNPIVVEIGPHSALAGPLRQIFQAADASFTYVPSLKRDKDDTESVLNCLGSLWSNNLDVNFNAVNPVGNVLTDLPTYSWNHSKSLWWESRISREYREREFVPHEALGVRLPGASQLEPTWRNVMTLQKTGWVRDHVVGSEIILPGAAFIAMAGEAVRQLTGRSDYSVRDVAITTALIFQESKENDVITTLKQAKLTSKTDSQWWDFRITSFNGSTWSEHCSGQVKPGPVYDTRTTVAPPPPQQAHFARKVSAKRWYGGMQKLGFAFGPRFRGLEGLSVDPITQDATATIENVAREDESFYELHPCDIDKLIQVMVFSRVGGDLSTVKQVGVPTYLAEAYISSVGGASKCRLTATSRSDYLGIWSDCFGTANGKVVLEVRGLRISDAGAAPDAEAPKHAVELEWKPDLDFMDMKELICTNPLEPRTALQLEEHFFLLALETVSAIAAIQPQESHLVKFREWLNRFVEKASRGEHRLIPKGRELAALGASQRRALVESLAKELESSPMAAIATASRRVQEHARAQFEGSITNLDSLLEGGLLTQIYDAMGTFWDYSPFLQALGHKKPTMRILEIGAGTGGLTSRILGGLRSRSGERLFSTYTYTDISAGFFVAAKERFKDYSGLEFSVLDISKDPLEQGFEAGSYDLILAANVLHATPSLRDTLKNVRKLLRPQGRLLLCELDVQAQWIGYIMGGFEGWWLGEADGRPDQPSISPERWDQELKASGFSGADVVTFDAEKPYQICATIVASPVQAPIEKKPVTLLHRGEVSEHVARIKDGFEGAGHAVTLTRFGGGSSSNSLAPGQDIVALLELEDALVHNISEADFDHLMSILRGLGSNKVVWLTRTASMGAHDPRFAQILGLSRTLRSEKQVSFTVFEVDDVASPVLPEKTVQLYQQTLRLKHDPEMDPDYEFALKDGVVYVSRYHWYSVSEKLSTMGQDFSNKTLVVGRKGMMDSLYWAENVSVKRPLGDGEIRVKTHTVGINFRDILVTQGLIMADKIGYECSGTVLEVGPGVTEFQVGDRILTGGESHFFTNQVIAHQDLVAKIPDHLSMEDAGGMPVVFGTVIYALLHCRRLQEGDVILIHSACGAVGLAAIQIAQMVGAKVLATVGNQEKVDYLVENIGLPREQIFDSRSNKFVKDVMAATDGRGVDVALNSLSGELLHATWSCIAPLGTMIELGKRDLEGHGKLDMFPMTANRSFIGLDILHLLVQRPKMGGQILRELGQLCEQGHVRPVPTFRNYRATEVVEAFRHMQRGTHIGKFTATMPEDPRELPVTKRQPNLNLRADASYLLVGGLGGLGRSLALWLVENGAKNLVFLSRSGRSGKGEDICRELEALGCNVQVFKGSVAKMNDVKEAVAGAVKPIRGVLQLSMVLRDRGLDDMSFEDWHAAVGPKVDGAWNLHEALGDGLDFFVMFSSASGLVGLYGQANYAAANTFLDAFAQYRHSKGLAASVINLGVVVEVGYVAESETISDRMRSHDWYLMGEEELRDTVRLAVVQSSPGGGGGEQALRAYSYSNPSEITVGMLSHRPFSEPDNRLPWKRDPRFSMLRNMETTASGGNAAKGGLRSLLANIKSSGGTGDVGKESTELVAREIGTALYRLMMADLEGMKLDVTLVSMGLDSLMCIEFRNWYKTQTGLDLSMFEMMQSSLRELGRKALEFLARKDD